MTVEGQAGIGDLLRTTLAATRPRGFAVEGEATASGGIVEGWFAFETAVARGRGYVRLKDGKGWTLLTTIAELKGYEEKRGPLRDRGIQHGVVAKGRETWLERKTAEEARAWLRRQPYTVIIGGGQGGIGLGARLRGSACPPSSSRRTRVRVTRGATATSPSTCTIRSGTTTCPT